MDTGQTRGKERRGKVAAIFQGLQPQPVVKCLTGAYPQPIMHEISSK